MLSWREVDHTGISSETLVAGLGQWWPDFCDRPLLGGVRPSSMLLLAGEENTAVHMLEGSTFFSHMQSTALRRATVGLILFIGKKDALLPVEQECDFEVLPDGVGLNDRYVRCNIDC